MLSRPFYRTKAEDLSLYTNSELLDYYTDIVITLNQRYSRRVGHLAELYAQEILYRMRPYNCYEQMAQDEEDLKVDSIHEKVKIL